MDGFTAGNISGLAQIIVGHPLDTYKVWLQSGTKTSMKPTSLLTPVCVCGCAPNTAVGTTFMNSQRRILC